MSDEHNEIPSAVKEVAKTTGIAIETVQRLGQWSARVMDDSVEAAVGILTDALRFLRWERQVALMEKTMRIVHEKELQSRRPVPPKFLLPLFSYASLEEDEDLHSMYAELLASAMDPNMKVPRVAYAEIIRQMDPLDGLMYKQALHFPVLRPAHGEKPLVSDDAIIHHENGTVHIVGTLSEPSDLMDQLRAWDTGQMSINPVLLPVAKAATAYAIHDSMKNLERLGLIFCDGPKEHLNLPVKNDWKVEMEQCANSGRFSLTLFGVDFACACGLFSNKKANEIRFTIPKEEA